MIYAFAILPAPMPSIEPQGIQDRIHYLQVGDLVAVVETEINVQVLEQAGEEQLLQAVLGHDRVIGELFSALFEQSSSLLPLRFGTVFLSQSALEEYLRSNHTSLVDRLQQLSGCSEYVLKGKFTPPKISQPAEDLKGKDYLVAKRTLYLQQQQVRSKQQEEYNDLITLLNASSQEIQTGVAQTAEDIKAFILLNSTQAQSIRESLTQWQSQHPAWQLDLSEALPPYHFADRDSKTKTPLINAS